MLKDMICRGLLLQVEAQGLIKLPPSRQIPPHLLSPRKRPAVVWLKTFVDPARGFEGTCYKAANWSYLGQTTGRGKNDQTHQVNRSLKLVFEYPLRKDFREVLCGQ